MKAKEQMLSIIAPLYNEEGNVEQLHKEILDVVRSNNLKAEIIFIDDGSTDKTLELAKKLNPVKLIIFRRNFGQTAAMDAGIKAARGDLIVTMDGDLQNDPGEIPKLLEKLDEGFDAVCGWRKNRKDPWSKKVFSRGADKLRKLLVNDQINDSGCTLKVFKRESFEKVDLYGEMHRFIPALLKIRGFKIGETVVNHRERYAGETKYSSTRLLKGLLDLLAVWFWRKFSNRPLHLFGGLGFLLGLVGSVLLIWMAYERLILSLPIGGRIWPMLGVFLVILGVQFFVFGLIADILIKTFYRARNETRLSSSSFTSIYFP